MKPALLQFYVILMQCLLSGFCLGQPTTDQYVRTRIDSLLVLSTRYFDMNNIDSALLVNELALGLFPDTLNPIYPAFPRVCQNLGRLYLATERLQDAHSFMSRSVSAFEKYPGKNSTDYANSLNFLGLIYQRLGNAEKAEECMIDAKAIRINVLGEKHADVAQSYRYIGGLHKETGDYEGAIENLKESLAITEATLGKQNKQYADGLTELASVYKIIRKRNEAESLYLEALGILLQTYGNEHPSYITCINDLGLLYWEMGEFSKAESYYLVSKEMREKIEGKYQPSYCGSLINLGLLNASMGKHKVAESYYLEAKLIFESLPNYELHPYYMNCLFNLTLLYLETGYFEKAISSALKAKRLVLQKWGSQNPAFADCTYLLGHVYRETGEYEKAEKNLLESMMIRDSIETMKSKTYMECLNDLGLLYLEIGQPEKAESYFNSIKDILDLQSDDQMTNYSSYFHNMGLIYYQKGELERAEDLTMHALNMTKRAYGSDHVEYAKSLLNYGTILSDRHHFIKADSAYQIALEIYGRSAATCESCYLELLYAIAGLKLKMENFHSADTTLQLLFDKLDSYYNIENIKHLRGLDLQTKINFALGRNEEMIQSLAQMAQLDMRLFMRASRYFTTHEIEAYLHYSPYIFDWFGNILEDSVDTRLLIPLTNYLLFQKGIMLRSAQRLNSIIETTNDSIQQLFYTWKGLSRELAQLYIQPHSTPEAIQTNENEINRIEKELTQHVAQFLSWNEEVEYKDLIDMLLPIEVAIEFIHYSINGPDGKKETHYGAIVISPNTSQPHFIRLFKESDLETLFKEGEIPNNAYLCSAYTNTDQYGQSSSACGGLSKLLWSPLEAYLTGIKTVYYAPAGLLHRINIVAVPISNDELFSDRFNMVRLNSIRQINTLKEQIQTRNQAIIYGGIDFEYTAYDTINVATSSERSSGGTNFSNVDSTLRGGSWGNLPNTQKEAEQIVEILTSVNVQVEVYTKDLATEERINSYCFQGHSSPRILHLATHGYFFPDPKLPYEQIGDYGNLFETTSETYSKFNTSDHPLIRSGLILAGGNYAWKHGHPYKPGMEDGILTAYEISQMDLSNTELVVLSACETGLGDIKGNEGVYGLQRAFKIAGVKNLIMSLWKVPDAATAELMISFYKHWLEDKMTIRQALYTAQKELRDDGFEPFYWAGWVLVE